MANKTIDYDATLREFFSEILKFLYNQEKTAKDTVKSAKINAAIKMVTQVANNPKKFGDYRARASAGMENGDFVDAFLRGRNNDNGIWLTYSAVLNAMADLSDKNDYKREQAQKKLLNALKTLKYTNSTNLLKDFTFAFKSPKSFAIKSTKQHQI